MSSDVALLLVDAARLTTDPHTQAVYLKELFKHVLSNIRRMRNELLDDGKRLIQFPRIWVLTLSKADLLPEMTATEFADVLTLHAGEDINQLRKAIADLVEEGAVSLGEDFLRLSSAQFTPGEIDTQTTIGLDMIVPLTMLLPVDHFARWQERKLLPAQKTRQVLQQFNHMSETLNLDLRAMAGVSLMSRFANKVPKIGRAHV